METIFTTITTVLIPFIFILIPAFIGLIFGGMLGLILGLNIGAILTVEFLAYPDYLLIGLVIVDVVLYFTGVRDVT